MKININPVPASRPRVTRYGVYYGKRYTLFRKQLKALIEKMNIEKKDGGLKVCAVFNVEMTKSWSKKKKSQLDGKYCMNNSDLDNYLKQYLTA